MTHVRSLFPTRIYEADLAAEAGFPGLLQELLDACGMLAEEDQAGRRWCQANGYKGYTSYASLDDLPKRASAFDALRRRLDRHAARFAETLLFELGARRLKLDSLWVNLLDPAGAHSGHIHPNSVLSGTVYLEVPPASGALRLEDPRLPLMMAAPSQRADAPEEERRFVYLAPKAGTLFLWESWLRHEVCPNLSRRRRVSVSFNYA
jgi:uncharacterized protein (TIGR02466 family)